jgi:hypothetical protein
MLWNNILQNLEGFFGSVVVMEKEEGGLSRMLERDISAHVREFQWMEVLVWMVGNGLELNQSPHTLTYCTFHANYLWQRVGNSGLGRCFPDFLTHQITLSTAVPWSIREALVRRTRCKEKHLIQLTEYSAYITYKRVRYRGTDIKRSHKEIIRKVLGSIHHTSAESF